MWARRCSIACRTDVGTSMVALIEVSRTISRTTKGLPFVRFTRSSSKPSSNVAPSERARLSTSLRWSPPSGHRVVRGAMSASASLTSWGSFGRTVAASTIAAPIASRARKR